MNRKNITYSQANEVKEILLKSIDEKDYSIEVGNGVRMPRILTIQHVDGSLLKFVSAVFRRVSDFVFVFTEHHGNFLYQETDISSVKEDVVTRTVYEDKAEYHYLEYEWDEFIEDEDREPVVTLEELEGKVC